MKMKQFIDGDLRSYSIYDNVRSIPSMVDGFKPSQRKVIYGMLKRGENAGEMKVAQAGAYVASVSDYHHGEASLESTIVGLAQDFTGSNNINFLIPEGQFGSRLSPSAASSRYIFTRFSPAFRDVFKKEDDNILEYQDSDGQEIEPFVYYPILPVLLINGSSGIGTGFASDIMNYRPADLKEHILDLLRNKKPKDLHPWYDGFTGNIFRDGDHVIIEGKYEIINTNTIVITEIPIGMYNAKYRAYLNKLVESRFITDYEDESTEQKVLFTLKVPRTTSSMSHEDLIRKFKLSTRSSENITVWTENNRIRNFESVEELVKHFVDFRLTKYDLRRVVMLDKMSTDLFLLEEKKRFIEFYIANSILFSKKTKKQLVDLLVDNKFHEDHHEKLLNLKIYNLTKDDINKLNITIKNTKADKKKLEAKTGKDIYIQELNELNL